MRVQANEMFDEFFNECFDKVQIGVLTFDPAYALRCCDPIAYEMAVQEYLDEMCEYECPEEEDDTSDNTNDEDGEE